jgi:hypothetical protein
MDILDAASSILPLAFGSYLSAFSLQPSAVSYQLSAISRQRTITA